MTEAALKESQPQIIEPEPISSHRLNELQFLNSYVLWTANAIYFNYVLNL